jgi:hypothetical protein
MSNIKIGAFEGDWQLKDRKNQVELWYNAQSDNWQVNLYEYINSADDSFYLHAIRRNEEEAREIFDTVVGLLK